MAWLQRLSSGSFHISFRIGSTKFKRSLDTDDEAQAVGLLSRLKENLQLVKRGRLAIPDGADIPTFLLTDGRLTGVVTVKPRLTLKQTFAAYFASLPEGHLEQSTIDCMRSHERTLVNYLGASFQLQKLTLSDLQSVIDARSKLKGCRGKPLTSSTLNRPIVTLRTIWNWAVQHHHLEGSFPNRGLKYPKGKEKPPFQTWEEIERQAKGMSEPDAAELWDCLFLTRQEVGDLLRHVKASANHPFIYPMFVLAAHTGARRSEIVRSRLTDLDFTGRTIIIHERKKNHERLTYRRVPMSPLLYKVLKEWLKVHPGGPHTFTLGINVQRSRKHRTECEPITRNEANDHFERTLAGSKWDRLRGWHCLRHSFASNCAAQRIDQRIINTWMGHQTEEMVRRYRHLIPNQEQEAIRAVFA